MSDPFTEKGIVPQLMGGLGNQMFTMSACIVASEVLGCPLYIPTADSTTNKHNHFKLNYNTSIFKTVGTQVDFPDVIFRHYCVQHGYSVLKQPVSGFHPWEPRTIHPGSILHGYFQYYPTLEPYELQLRATYLKGLQSLREWYQSEANFDNTAFLHVRRGDYLEYSDIHFNQPLSYYEKALKHLPASVERILCFSDDPEWVAKQELFQGGKFQVVKGLNEIETLAMMSLCRSGAICANSTFSWWGAFLGAYADRSPVVVPKRWICDTVVSLFPSEWIVLE